MNEFEARALNMNADAWKDRIARGLRESDKRTPLGSPRYDPAMTMEELLGKNVCDAILDVVAE